jgi:hypothetical protein
MKIQNVPGIYVYYVDDNFGLVSRRVAYYYFDTWENFFNYFSQWSILCQFVNWDKIWYKVSDEDKAARYYSYAYRNHPVYYAAYDQDGNWLSPSYISGFYDAWKKQRDYRWKVRCHNRRHGRKRGAYGSYRRIHTLGANRNDFYDVDAQELDIVIQYRRKAVPPDAWDREAFSNAEKSWKYQSKREHQWK